MFMRNYFIQHIDYISYLMIHNYFLTLNTLLVIFISCLIWLYRTHNKLATKAIAMTLSCKVKKEWEV